MTVNWLDAKEIMKDTNIFLKLIFSLFGVYVWELFMTWDFEWSLITKFFFFLCHYCMLFTLVGFLFKPFSTRQALYTFNSWTGKMSILCASMSLMLRIIMFWECQKIIIILLGVLCLAHWALLYQTMFIVTAVWEDHTLGCVITGTNPSLLNTTFFFTIGFDFIIFVFTAVVLLKKHSASAQTDLWKLLFQDGLIYFLVSFSMNCIPAPLFIFNLNAT
ncbi:hypothetical protein L208DRAFT_1425050 [Tricholoma matsutake]|nr:hypothetical protein L208DRAFT_1425050 [Tricholoma matsutake 945]